MAAHYDLTISAVDPEGWLSATVRYVDEAGDVDLTDANVEAAADAPTEPPAVVPRVDLTLADGHAGHMVAWSCLEVGTLASGASQTVHASLPEMLHPVELGEIQDAWFKLGATVVVDEEVVAWTDDSRLVQRVDHAWKEA